MRTRPAAACALLLLLPTIGTPASAHRLDEYLQAITISIEPNRVQAQMRLTPGVAVFPAVFAAMDTNSDGVLSEAERKVYAERVLRDVALTLDGSHLRLRLVSWKFAKIEEMKEGRGEIQIEFSADVPRSDGNRRLLFENHHQPRIAVYLVNCLVPRDPNIQVTGQQRNYQQSRYELHYVQAGVSSRRVSSAEWPDLKIWPGVVLLLLSAAFGWLWRVRRPGNRSSTRRHEYTGSSRC